MKKVKITVLRKTLQEDLAREYGVEGLTACPMLRSVIFKLEATDIEAEIGYTPVE